MPLIGEAQAAAYGSRVFRLPGSFPQAAGTSAENYVNVYSSCNKLLTNIQNQDWIMDIDLSLRETFLQFLLSSDAISEEHALQALDLQRKRTPPIGRLALKQGYLTMRQVMEVLGLQVDTDMRFGEIAIQQGFIDPQQLDELLYGQRAMRTQICDILLELEAIDEPSLNDMRRRFLDTTSTAIC